MHRKLCVSCGSNERRVLCRDRVMCVRVIDRDVRSKSSSVLTMLSKARTTKSSVYNYVIFAVEAISSINRVVTGTHTYTEFERTKPLLWVSLSKNFSTGSYIGFPISFIPQIPLHVAQNFSTHTHTRTLAKDISSTWVNSFVYVSTAAYIYCILLHYYVLEEPLAPSSSLSGV